MSAARADSGVFKHLAINASICPRRSTVATSSLAARSRTVNPLISGLFDSVVKRTLTLSTAPSDRSDPVRWVRKVSRFYPLIVPYHTRPGTLARWNVLQ